MFKGNLVLINFPFTDLSGSKLLPAVVLTQANLDLTVCFITTQIQWQEKTDILLKPNAANGLKSISLVRLSKIATLDKSLSKGILGRLNQSELLELDTNLKLLFQLA